MATAMEVTVNLRTSPEGANSLLNKDAEPVVVRNNPENPTKVDISVGGKTYTFVTAELGTAIMKASLIHG